MNNDLKNIFKKATIVRLSSIEKREIKNRLVLFVEKHPVRNDAMERHLLQRMSYSHILNTIKKPMSIILIIALLFGGGASFAAESSLPGDILYPVKVSVNEEVRGWLAVSDKAQAEWDARLAERRLEEAEELVSEGRLDAEVSADLESRFESHSQAFRDRVEKIEEKQGAQAAFEVHSNLEASLEAHERVLTRFATKKGQAGVDVDVVGPILVNVRAQLNTTIQDRSAAEAKVSAQVDGEFQSASEGKLKAAENKVREVRVFIDAKKSLVSAEVSSRAEARLAVAEQVIVRGKAEMESKNYGKAFVSFQEALRIAQEAKLSISGEERIRLNVRLPGVGVNVGGDDRKDDSRLKEEMEVNTDAEVSGDGSSDVSGESSVDSETDVEIRGGSTEVKGRGEVNVDVGL